MVHPPTLAAIGLVIALIIATAIGFWKGPSRLIGEGPGKCEFSPMICRWGEAVGIPGFFLTTRHFFWYFLAPVAAIGVITYGFLDTLRLFKRPVNVILATAIAAICIPTQVVTAMVSTMLAFLGAYAMWAFVVVFVVGITLASAGTLGRVRKEFAPLVADIDRKIDEINYRIAQLSDKKYREKWHISEDVAADEIRSLEEKRARLQIRKKHIIALKKEKI